MLSSVVALYSDILISLLIRDVAFYSAFPLGSLSSSLWQNHVVILMRLELYQSTHRGDRLFIIHFE